MGFVGISGRSQKMSGWRTGMAQPVLRSAVVFTLIGGFAFIARAGGADDGQAAFATCLACHSVGPNAQHKNGPVLNGVAGKPAGSASDFVYSEALQTAKVGGLIWTDDNLDKYLADPITFIPGGRMAWTVPDAAQRQALIAYLKTLP